jgi:hypothetical protein
VNRAKAARSPFRALSTSSRHIGSLLIGSMRRLSHERTVKVKIRSIFVPERRGLFGTRD